MVENPYFQFPLCALSFGQTVDARLNAILDYSVVEAGSQLFRKLTAEQQREFLAGRRQLGKFCEQRYAIFVPQRLVPTRGLLTIKDALINCPHAAIGGDGQHMERLKELARKLGGAFIPELICDSIGQCVAAVETGVFASVLPVQVWTASSEKDYVVVEDDSLDILSRQIVLAWHPRTVEVMGSAALKIRQALADALKEQGAKTE